MLVGIIAQSLAKLHYTPTLIALIAITTHRDLSLKSILDSISKHKTGPDVSADTWIFN